jgi:hypothetical protein
LKTIAVIPVKGRLPLLRVTLSRLHEKNRVEHIICVGDTEEERKLCNSCGAEFVEHPNNPLGKKWNAGFLKAKVYNPDFIVYVGSSDWLSDNWVNTMLPYAEKHLLVGKRDFYMLHYYRTWLIREHKIKLALWPHYPKDSPRFDEPIGIGRILSREFLECVNWMPFDDWRNDAMDACMWRKLKEVQLLTGKEKEEIDPKFTCGVIENENIKSLAVSCDAWGNLHKSDFRFPHIEYNDTKQLWLLKYFPEALKIEL